MPCYANQGRNSRKKFLSCACHVRSRSAELSFIYCLGDPGSSHLSLLLFQHLAYKEEYGKLWTASDQKWHISSLRAHCTDLVPWTLTTFRAAWAFPCAQEWRETRYGKHWASLLLLPMAKLIQCGADVFMATIFKIVSDRHIWRLQHVPTASGTMKSPWSWGPAFKRHGGPRLLHHQHPGTSCHLFLTWRYRWIPVVSV